MITAARCARCLSAVDCLLGLQACRNHPSWEVQVLGMLSSELLPVQVDEMLNLVLSIRDAQSPNGRSPAQILRLWQMAKFVEFHKCQ